MLPAIYDVTEKVVFITRGWARDWQRDCAGVAAAGADVVLNVLIPRYVENTAAEIAKHTGRRVMSRCWPM